MVKPRERTRSRKRLAKPLPGGKTSIKFKSEIGALPRCNRCGALLAGISNSSPLKARRSTKSKKTIWRLRGGQLCPNCLKIALRQSARTR